MTERPPITPDTKVAQLLEAYPKLEPVLIAAAPAFSKLSNPVLRRTIARVTSLRRAAEVAGLPVRDLVLRLREAAGLPAGDAGPVADESTPDEGPASWVDPARVRWTIDADSMLESGHEPMSEVLRRSAELGTDDLGLIRSSFRPAPLIELLEGRGFKTAVVRSGAAFATFIGPRQGGS